jgi:hypothetical protein
MKAIQRMYGAAPPAEVKAAANERLLRSLAGLAKTARRPPRTEQTSRRKQAAKLAAQVEAHTAQATAAAARAAAAQQKIPGAEAQVRQFQGQVQSALAGRADAATVNNIARQLHAAQEELAALQDETTQLHAQESAATLKAAAAQAQLDATNAAITAAIAHDVRKAQRKKDRAAAGGDKSEGTSAEAGAPGVEGFFAPAPVADGESGGLPSQQRQRTDGTDDTTKFGSDSTLAVASPIGTGRHHTFFDLPGQAQQNLRRMTAYFPKALPKEATSASSSPLQPFLRMMPMMTNAARFIPH